MYNLTYTARGVKCRISADEWDKMTDRAKKSIETMCEQMKAKLVIK